MVDFRKKLLGLAGMAVACAGMANAQCTTLGATPGASFIRAEGQTELLPQMTLSSCTISGGVTANVTVFLSPAVTITSAASGVTTSTSAPSGSTEAQLQVNGGGTAYYGVVTGSSVTFSNVTVAAANPNFVISNVRVNATTIPSVAGQAPTAISAQAFVSGTNVTPGPTTSTAVAYALNGLQSSKIYNSAAQSSTGLVSGTISSTFGVCGSVNASSTSGSALVDFYVSVNENFSTAFKSKNSSGIAYTSGAESSNTGLEVAGSATNIVNSGTRIQVVFSNVPTGLNIFVPTSVTATDGAVLTGQLSASSPSNGSANFTTVSTSPSSINGQNLFQVPVTNGTATAIYEVTTDSAGMDVFSIPVTLNASSNTVVNQTSTMTVTTSFAPVTATPTSSATSIPSFAVGSSTAAVNILSTSLCQTTLLFPFVTNQAGFETGIAISNTSKDPGLSSGAKAQSGTCTLNYYGTSATNPTATVAPNTNETSGAPFLAGEAYAFTLTNALAATTGNPATFQGYIIAQCQFQYAHGFAYIVYNFPGTSSDTMGYLALVLNSRGSTGAESTFQ